MMLKLVTTGQFRKDYKCVKLCKLKILNAFQIKLLMAFLMLLDHLHYIHGLVPPETRAVLTLISRCVAPMFAYLAVEGIRHTHDLKRYCQRLAVWAAVVYMGNALLNRLFRIMSGTLPEAERALLYRNSNAVFTLALGTIGIALVLWGKRQKTAAGKWAYVLSAVVFLCGFLYGEWGSVVLPFMYIEYFLRERRCLRLSGYALTEIMAVLLPWGEPFWFLVFPFIFLYNGKRGPETRFSKNFFYLFYAVHLWVIAIINFLVVSAP